MDDKRLTRIEEKIDDTNDHLASIDITLSAQHVSLKDHIRRTAILEAEIKPIRKHVDMMNGALKLAGIIALLIGIIEGIAALLK